MEFNFLLNYNLPNFKWGKGNTTGYKVNTTVPLRVQTSLPPEQIWFFCDLASRMKIPHLQCRSDKKRTNQAVQRPMSLHSFHLFSSLKGWKAPFQQHLNHSVQGLLYECPAKMPKHPTSQDIPWSQSWMINIIDIEHPLILGVMSLTNQGSPTPAANHHGDGNPTRPSYVITMAVMATASLSNLPCGVLQHSNGMRSNHTCENV